MSYGGSPSCGFDDIDDYGRVDIPRDIPKKRKQKKCRNCRYFTYHIHHRSSCELFPEEGFCKTRDGRGIYKLC